MQHRYVGDIGDFCKYALLKNICGNEICLGVNWYLNEQEEENNDGEITDYSQYEVFDPPLYLLLKSILNSKQRDVREIKNRGILPINTRFYNKPLPEDDPFKRDEWFDESLSTLQDCEIIFCDPDNGLEVASCSKYHPQKAVKYVFFDEVKELYRKNKSLIVYQHPTRKGQHVEQIKERKKQLEKVLKIDSDQQQIKSVYSSSGTFFLIVQQKIHKKIIDNKLSIIKNEFQGLLKVV